jgi:hypothetical protein
MRKTTTEILDFVQNDDLSISGWLLNGERPGVVAGSFLFNPTTLSIQDGA